MIVANYSMDGLVAPRRPMKFCVGDGRRSPRLISAEFCVWTAVILLVVRIESGATNSFTSDGMNQT